MLANGSASYQWLAIASVLIVVFALFIWIGAWIGARCGSSVFRFLRRVWVEVLFVASAYAVWHFMPVFPRATLPGQSLVLGFSEDSSIVATEDLYGTPHFWDVASGEEVSFRSSSPLGPPSPVDKPPAFDSPSFSPDGKYCVTGEFRRAVGVWDVAEGEQSALLNDVPSLVNRGNSTYVDRFSFQSLDPVFLSDGRTLAYPSNGVVTLWDLPTRRVRCVLRDERKNFGSGRGCFAVSPNGEIVATSSVPWAPSWGIGSSSVALWNVETGQRLATLPLSQPDFAIISVAFSPDGNWLVCGSVRAYGEEEAGAKRMTFFDVAKRSEICTVNAEARSIKFNTASATMITNRSTLWDISTLPPKLLCEGLRVAVSPDGSLVATVKVPYRHEEERYDEDTLEIRRLPSLEEIRTIRIPGLRSERFLPDNRTLLLGTASDWFPPFAHWLWRSRHTLTLRDAMTGWPRGTIVASGKYLSADGQIALAAVAPDGKTVAAYKRGLKLWDCPFRRPLLRILALWSALVVGYVFVRRRVALRLLRRDAGRIKYRTGQKEGSEYQ